MIATPSQSLVSNTLWHYCVQKTFLTPVGEPRLRNEPPFFINNHGIEKLYNDSVNVLPLINGVLPHEVLNDVAVPDEE